MENRRDIFVIVRTGWMDDLTQTLCTEMRRRAASSVKGSGRPVGAQEVLVAVNQGLRRLRQLPPGYYRAAPLGLRVENAGSCS